MNYKFKKIASATASAVMMFSTVALAAAANYPDPFVKNGNADVAVIWGSAPAAQVDLTGVLDITNSLNRAIISQGGGTDGEGGSNLIGGDAILLAKPSDNLNIGNTWSGVFTGNVADEDLPELLADGTYIADDNDRYDYEQRISLGAPTFSHFRDSDYESLVGLEDRTPALGFHIGSNTYIMNYTLDFNEDPESDIVSSDLDDFEGSVIRLLGRDYYISDAKNGSSSTYLGKFTLLDTSTSGVVNEGEVANVVVGDTSYEISIHTLTTSQARLNVNGELTNELSEGDTFPLADGNLYIGIKDIFQRDVQGTVGNVEFTLGSGKLEIPGNGEDVEINDEAITGMKGYIERSTGSSGSEKMDKIILQWRTDEEAFLSPEAELLMPAFEAVKFTMPQIVRPEEEVVKVEKDGDNSLRLSVPIKDGTVDVNILFNSESTGNFTGIGKDTDERLATSNSSTLTFIEKDSGGLDYHDRFVASYATSSEAESYVLRAKVTTDSSANRNETTIEKLEGNSWVAVCDGKAASDTCDIGQVSLTITSIGYIAGSGGGENVTLTAGTGVDFHTIYTKGGLKIYLPYTVANTTLNSANGAITFNDTATDPVAGHSSDTFYLFMDGEDKDDDIAAGTEFNFTINDNSDKNIQVTQVNNAGSGGSGALEVGDTSTYENYISDDVAPRVLHYTNPDEDWAEVYYPTGESETYAEVYLADSAAEAGEGGEGGLSDIAQVMDTEVGTVSGRNWIVVGGACINTAAADLLLSSGPLCGSDWETETGIGSGQFLIETFSRSGGKIATLVAGYNQADTMNAARYLTTQTAVSTMPGDKYVGTSSTSAELVTGGEEA